MLHRFLITLTFAIGCSQSILSMDREADGPNQEIQKLNTQLIDAILYGFQHTIRDLLAAGAQVDTKEPTRGNTALMCAVSTGKYYRCKPLIDHGAQVNAKNNNGVTALIMAAQLGNDEICDLLINHGAQIDAQETNFEITALMMAAAKNQGSTCKLLIDHGAHLHTKNYEGYTALHYAAYPKNNWPQFFRNVDTSVGKLFKPNDEIWACKTLLDCGAPINMRSNNGATPLILATMNGNIPVCKILVIYPLFNPSVSQNEFQISQKRIFTVLCAFRRACPQIYVQKDIRYKILFDYLLEDVDNSACAIHKNRHARAPFLPLATIRQLIRNDILDTEKAVAAIKAHHFACLKPLMLEAIPHAKTDKIRTLLNPDNIETNFGADIELAIKNRLGIPSAWAGFAQTSACNMQ